MAVPYTFGSILGGASIPLSELDDNFSYLTTSPTFTGNVTVNGNVGIGTSSPSTKLTVDGTITATSGGPFADLVLKTTSVTTAIFSAESGSGVVGTVSNHPLAFYTNNTERARIDGSGNLGVGTTSPVARLDVYNGSGASTSTVRAASGQNAFLSVIGNGNSFLSTSFDIIQDSTNTASIFQRANAPLLFGTNNTERARIDGSGNVVINTAAIATNATNGFLYVPTCAGTPTGTPTAYAGRSPIVVDTTNNKLYFYSGGAWRDAGP